MPDELYLLKERRLFRRAVWAAIFLHTGVLLGIIWAARPEPLNPFQPLAEVSFAYFDPEGGEPGGGDTDEPAEMSRGASEPEPEAQPETQPEPVSELEAEPEVRPEIIESVSEKALPTPPPKEAKPKPRPTPKPAAKPAALPKAAAGEEKAGLPGGGPGNKGRGGLGGGSGQGNPDELKAYLARVQRRLVSARKYPPAARAQKLEGEAMVSFVLAPDGRALSARLVKSSGHVVLDEEAMAMLRRVSPFPARPKNLPQDNLSLTVPIRFSLR
ncbi:MAG: TonB family protein [Deltaproteobacteria bacterium]|nr:TonB family protein [Deltaproteobacteria bacterium]